MCWVVFSQYDPNRRHQGRKNFNWGIASITLVCQPACCTLSWLIIGVRRSSPLWDVATLVSTESYKIADWVWHRNQEREQCPSSGFAWLLGSMFLLCFLALESSENGQHLANGNKCFFYQGWPSCCYWIGFVFNCCCWCCCSAFQNNTKKARAVSKNYSQ